MPPAIWNEIERVIPDPLKITGDVEQNIKNLSKDQLKTYGLSRCAECSGDCPDCVISKIAKSGDLETMQLMEALRQEPDFKEFDPTGGELSFSDFDPNVLAKNSSPDSEYNLPVIKDAETIDARNKEYYESKKAGLEPSGIKLCDGCTGQCPDCVLSDIAKLDPSVINGLLSNIEQQIDFKGFDINAGELSFGNIPLTTTATTKPVIVNTVNTNVAKPDQSLEKTFAHEKNTPKSDLYHKKSSHIDRDKIPPQLAKYKSEQATITEPLRKESASIKLKELSTTIERARPIDTNRREQLNVRLNDARESSIGEKNNAHIIKPSIIPNINSNRPVSISQQPANNQFQTRIQSVTKSLIHDQSSTLYRTAQAAESSRADRSRASVAKKQQLYTDENFKTVALKQYPRSKTDISTSQALTKGNKDKLEATSKIFKAEARKDPEMDKPKNKELLNKDQAKVGGFKLSRTNTIELIKEDYPRDLKPSEKTLYKSVAVSERENELLNLKEYGNEPSINTENEQENEVLNEPIEDIDIGTNPESLAEFTELMELEELEQAEIFNSAPLIDPELADNIEESNMEEEIEALEESEDIIASFAIDSESEIDQALYNEDINDWIIDPDFELNTKKLEKYSPDNLDYDHEVDDIEWKSDVSRTIQISNDQLDQLILQENLKDLINSEEINIAQVIGLLNLKIEIKDPIDSLISDNQLSIENVMEGLDFELLERELSDLIEELFEHDPSVKVPTPNQIELDHSLALFMFLLIMQKQRNRLTELSQEEVYLLNIFLQKLGKQNLDLLSDYELEELLVMVKEKLTDQSGTPNF